MTNKQILKILNNIDRGYLPTQSERELLAEVKELDLSFFKITKLPSSIKILSALQVLRLCHSNITELPDSIGNLSALRNLDLSSTNLSVLPDSIGNLSALKSMDLSFTHLITLPDSIGKLTYLEEFYLFSSSITNLPDSIGNLTALAVLSLANTNIKMLPNSIGHVSALKRLYLSCTNIEFLPDSICDLPALQSLFVSASNITALPDRIGSLSTLQELYIDNTKISILPDSLINLLNLREFNLRKTDIITLPEWIGNLRKLKRLDLSELTLERIPQSLATRGLSFVEEENANSKKECVKLYKTILISQKKSIFIQTPELIPSLYSDQVILPECKVIFLGDGAAGKSYTLKRFVNKGKKETKQNPYITTETPGVEIVDYHVDRGKDSFDIHFWDFGGQQILHSMHRCFLTEQTCYVVVVQTRDTEANRHANYWLQNVTAFAPNSPVLLLVNCWENDNGMRSIDENKLRLSFPNISDVIYCSAKRSSNKEFHRFIDALIDMTIRSGYCFQTVNRRWEKVRREIIEENTDYLTKERYYEICESCGIEDADASPLLTFFNNLGVCFSYHRNRELKELAEYKLLKPVWLTNAIYAIIEEGESYSFDGRIKLSAIKTMLCNPAPKIVRGKQYRRTMPEIVYKESACEYIIDVAAIHNLCYRVNSEVLFFPALCSNNTPVNELGEQVDFSNHMEYQLEYRYLPDSVVHQMMIRCLRKNLSINHCWLRGMVLGEINWYKVVIRMDDDYKTLKIDIYSKQDHPIYLLFRLLKEEILDINRTLNIEAREFIAMGNDRFTLLQLMRFFEDGQDVIFGDNTGEKYSVGELLGNFYDHKTLNSIVVNKNTINIPRNELNLHEHSKEDDVLRKALWKVYNGICQYCMNPVDSYSEMQVDHVFPEHYKKESVSQMTEYVEYLQSQGFNIDKPNYIENYLPVHASCNRKKSNSLSTFPLIWYHSISIGNAPKVLKEMKRMRKNIMM